MFSIPLRLTVAGLISFVFLCGLQSRGMAEPYAIDYKLNSTKSGSVLRIYDAATGRTQWQGRIGRVYFGGATKCLVWSQDKKAVAIIDDESGYWKHSWYYRLIVWQAGRPVKIYDYLQPLHEEGVDSLSWSPDNRRLLLQTAPGTEVQNSNLWCLRISTSQVQFIAGGVGRAYWINSRRIRYYESMSSQMRREQPRKTPSGKWQVKYYERTCQ